MDICVKMRKQWYSFCNLNSLHIICPRQLSSNLELRRMILIKKKKKPSLASFQFPSPPLSPIYLHTSLAPNSAVTAAENLTKVSK